MQTILVTVSIPNKNEELRLRSIEQVKEPAELEPQHDGSSATSFCDNTPLVADIALGDSASNAENSLQKLKTSFMGKLKDLATKTSSIVAASTVNMSPSGSSNMPTVPNTMPNNSAERLCFDFNMPADTSMEDILRIILRSFNVERAIWVPDVSGKRLRVQFHITSDATHKQFMLALRQWQIGVRYDSFVTSAPSFTSSSERTQQTQSNTAAGGLDKQSLRQRFMGAVKTRLLVMKIIKEMHEKAQLNFNFGLLLVSAATIACFALADNNAIFMVSCMLLSPLIGPIVAGLFGIFIGNMRLALLGLRNCAIGIMVATCVGLATGFVLAFADPRYRHGEGLTNEMIMRTDLYSLLTGSIVASTCGVAIAIAILNKNTSSLVGAAIAGSLLPPAVNAGFIWSMACVAKLYEPEALAYKSIVQTLQFANTTANELFILGSISMCLTFSNVVFIYLSGYLMLKLKEHMPGGATDTLQWQQSIALVRSYQRDANATNIVMEELHKLSETDQRALTLNNAIMTDILRKHGRIDRTCSTFPPKTTACAHTDTFSDVNPLPRPRAMTPTTRRHTRRKNVQRANSTSV